jgi:hypothetical protein
MTGTPWKDFLLLLANNTVMSQFMRWNPFVPGILGLLGLVLMFRGTLMPQDHNAASMLLDLFRSRR